MKKKIRLLNLILKTPKTEFISVRFIETATSISAYDFINMPETQAYIHGLIKIDAIESIAQLRRITEAEILMSPLLALRFLSMNNPNIQAEIYSMAYHFGSGL